jgi:pimeloyl-ACP methyl ester carboxylesterase
VPPETRYVRLQGDRIAYQVFGDGPPGLVVVPGSFGHLDIAWEDAGMTLFFRTLASFCRLIVFDRRGTGISDPLSPTPLPPWESYAQELAAVLDEVGTERPAILAEVDAGPPAIFFAATNPDRTSAFILAHTTAKLVAASDYPIGGCPQRPPRRSRPAPAPPTKAPSGCGWTCGPPMSTSSTTTCTRASPTCGPSCSPITRPARYSSGQPYEPRRRASRRQALVSDQDSRQSKKPPGPQPPKSDEPPGPQPPKSDEPPGPQPPKHA